MIMGRTSFLLVLLLSTPVEAETVLVEAGRDATLIEDPDGALANGSGPSFFVGRTNQAEGGVRRGLLYFDVAAGLPEQAIVESVSLSLSVGSSNPGAVEIRLHRLLAGWGEGPSASAGGQGAPSEPGDVSWIHTFYEDTFWIHSGGQFIGRESASLVVDGAGPYALESTTHLVQDVRLWLAAPQRNFGWILIGDETKRQTAQGFASREAPDPSLRPVLVVSYRLPGDR